MKEWDSILSQLADEPNDYDREGGTVAFVRHGKDVMFDVRHTPGVGYTVDVDTSTSGVQPVELFTYVQRNILELPRLASQVVRALGRTASRHPVSFVDGPAQFAEGSTQRDVESISIALQEFLSVQEPGATRLIQLMGQAGQGKTVLLEELAKRFAQSYQPAEHPIPLFLPIDLLGRYVGTIDDAIAGSLNNTYLFPGLNQRDVALCVRRNLLILALDGFDELVARVGPRDAFQRVTELLDQLDASGTILLSARESFFELYQISAAIRSYLRPNTGSYSTSFVRLLPWSEKQGIRVFANLGSTQPEQHLADLLSVFGSDRELVLQPFFVTRLAHLWMQGERFSGAAVGTGKMWRTKYLIDTYISRETDEKWRGRDDRPLLSTEGHAVLLSGIAEEMWRTGAFRLKADEMKVAAQIALQAIGLPRALEDDIVQRVPTHAAFAPRASAYAFVHDRFLDYYFGSRLASIIRAENKDLAITLLGVRELSPDIISWVEWRLTNDASDIGKCAEFLIDRARTSNDYAMGANVALLLGVLLPHCQGITVDAPIAFIGEALLGKRIVGHAFKGVNFWQIDLSGTTFDHVQLSGCSLSEVCFDSRTTLNDSEFLDCEVSSIDLGEDDRIFSPEQIQSTLVERGATVRYSKDQPILKSVPIDMLNKAAARAVQRLVSKSVRICDIAVEEFEEQFGDEGAHIVRTALNCGVVRQISRQTSGPRKEFVRFAVDRDLFLRGGREPVGDSQIDRFWKEVVSNS